MSLEQRQLPLQCAPSRGNPFSAGALQPGGKEVLESGSSKSAPAVNIVTGAMAKGVVLC